MSVRDLPLEAPEDGEPTGRPHGLGVRHRAREVALQVLFALDLQAKPGRNRSQAPPPELAVVFEEVSAHFEMPAAAREFALLLCEGAVRDGESVDRVITEHARHWRIDRMAIVDRNVLRLATWELMHSETPVPVVLDEAVELSRRFGADPSPAFVNGILDAVARSVRQEG